MNVTQTAIDEEGCGAAASLIDEIARRVRVAITEQRVEADSAKDADDSPRAHFFRGIEARAGIGVAVEEVDGAVGDDSCGE